MIYQRKEERNNLNKNLEKNIRKYNGKKMEFSTGKLSSFFHFIKKSQVKNKRNIFI